MNSQVIIIIGKPIKQQEKCNILSLYAIFIVLKCHLKKLKTFENKKVVTAKKKPNVGQQKSIFDRNLIDMALDQKHKLNLLEYNFKYK